MMRPRLSLKVPPPLVGAAVAAMMWAVARAVPVVMLPGTWARPLALFLALVALAVDGSALLSFRRARTTINPLKPGNASRLVTSGVYRITRNPMYLGMALLLTAWALWLGSPLALAGPLAFVIYITRFQILPEEQILTTVFGTPYVDYCRHVRRWI